jgi:hypothetical protein
MSVSVLGIDIAKQKFDAALLMDGKTKQLGGRFPSFFTAYPV